ncbi:hypothetical protein BSZ05_22835 [Vibrio mediterranei]|uniref:Uncharacterized protein n=1 Tax=Vibrio mediterranei TaxID=689 RepID=A0AAN1FL78_9VIBR|nr:hypothetical protein BSZ05_22835 [Vibrio mediterranei]
MKFLLSNNSIIYKAVNILFIIIFIPLLLIIAISFSDSLGCDYNLTINSQSINKITFLTCRRGALSAIIKQEYDDKKFINWRVKGWQFTLGQQVFMYVSSREIINQSNGPELDVTNELAKDYSLYAYHYHIVGNTAYIFNDRPINSYEIGTIEGRVSWFYGTNN